MSLRHLRSGRIQLPDSNSETINPAETANAKARLSSIEALDARLQLLIGKLEREKHGPRRERTQRLIDRKREFLRTF